MLQESDAEQTSTRVPVSAAEVVAPDALPLVAAVSSFALTLARSTQRPSSPQTRPDAHSVSLVQPDELGVDDEQPRRRRKGAITNA